ncbi:MAG: hypothetical protein WBO70_05965 [Erysipelotrichaceae bacterium]
MQENIYTYNLEDIPNEKIILTVKNRPWGVIIGFIALGAITLLVPNFWFFSAFLIITAIVAIVFIPEFKAFDFYENFMVAYSPSYPNKCEIIYYQNLISFATEQKTNQGIQLFFTKENEEVILPVKTLNGSKVHNYLNKVCPDKDLLSIKMSMFKNSARRTKKKKK